MLVIKKYTETEQHIFEHLQSKGFQIQRNDIEIDDLSEDEAKEYLETIKAMKDGEYTNLDDLEI
jgi:hypothetical protein